MNDFIKYKNLDNYPPAVASKYLTTDSRNVIVWNTPHINDFSGIDTLNAGLANHTVKVNPDSNALSYHDMTIKDASATGGQLPAGQISLLASDNNISTYSMKTVKAGDNVEITPDTDDSDCLVIKSRNLSVKNYDAVGASFNSNGDMTEHTLTLEDETSEYVNTASVFSGTDLTSDAVTGWTMSRGTTDGYRNVWYAQHGMKPELIPGGGNEPSIYQHLLTNQ